MKGKHITIVDEIPKRDFHQKILRNVVLGSETKAAFSRVVCEGAYFTSSDDKNAIRQALAENGVPLSEMMSDRELEEISRAIMARAVTVK